MDPQQGDQGKADLSRIEQALKDVVGVTIRELEHDLVEKLNDPLLGIEFRTELMFKAAKRRFKEDYIRAVLRRNFGNISEAARVLSLSRRTVHRLSEDEEVDRIRKEMASPRYLSQQDVAGAIHDVLQDYAEVLHPKKLAEVYGRMPSLSQDLAQVREIPSLSLKAAVEEFERRYLTAAVIKHGPLLTSVAKAIGIRYESLLRKAKQLGIGGQP